ncbi:MAG: DUF4491 family protein [Bacteroidales bacterium]|nr:DUF4491 family protein [Bacteroidales bacterium]
MDLTGIIIGGATFLTIGAFHPLVIKAEYYWGKRCWWSFLVLGLGCIAGSLLAGGVWSILLGVVGFSSLWGIHELLRQHNRVERGWFPQGPGHKTQK